MTVIVWPVDAIAGAPSNTGRMLRETLAPFLAGATAARPLGARSGVRPGTSVTTVTATSTDWTINPHAGILDMETAAEAGPYAFAINAAITGAMTAAHATLARIDIVWVRLDDPAESDGSSVPAVVAGYTAGTAAATPAAPATPARCMVLATIQVPASGGGAPTVIWAAPYTVGAGAPTPVRSAADRDAKFPVPYDGLQVYRLDLHKVETYNGTSWSTALGAVTASATTTQPAVGATPNQLLGAPAVTGDGVKTFKITVTYYAIAGTVIGDLFDVTVLRGVGGSQVGGVNTRIQVATVSMNGLSMSVFDTPPAGSVAYVMQLARATGTGTATIFANAAVPFQIIVEQIA